MKRSQLNAFIDETLVPIANYKHEEVSEITSLCYILVKSLIGNSQETETV